MTGCSTTTVPRARPMMECVDEKCVDSSAVCKTPRMSPTAFRSTPRSMAPRWMLNQRPGMSAKRQQRGTRAAAGMMSPNARLMNMPCTSIVVAGNGDNGGAGGLGGTGGGDGGHIGIAREVWEVGLPGSEISDV